MQFPSAARAFRSRAFRLIQTVAAWLDDTLEPADARRGDTAQPSARDELRTLLDEQRRIKRALDESRAGFMEVFRRAPSEMLITRMSDICILDVNDAWLRTSGFTREQVVGKSSLDFDWWPDPQVKERLIHGIQTQGYVEAIEASFITASGDEHVCLMNGQSITLDGEACVVWQSQDITAMRRAERERRELDARMKEREKLESLGMLAGGIAHDFNNLLVGILGNADLLLSRVPEDAPLHAPLEAIATSAERAAQLTRELLDYAGRGSTSFEPIELRALTDELAVLAAPHVPRQACFRRELPDREVWVDGDASQLTRMLLNMIVNGFDALEGGAGAVHVSLSVEHAEAGENAVLRAVDSGHGLDEATQKRIFEPFFSTKPKGRGLGLAAVQGIVQRHGGTLSVTSARHQGSTFTITLPMRPAPDLPREEHRTEHVAGHGRVLLVDDEATVRAVGSLLLTHLGFAVTEASSGEEAIAIVQREPDAFRLVVLDATMPGLDGWKTLEALREHAPDLPVLMCSGYARRDWARELAHVPHTSFLGKPFRVHELSRAISELLADTDAV